MNDKNGFESEDDDDDAGNHNNVNK